jgi:hypothetical protein
MAYQCFNRNRPTNFIEICKYWGNKCIRSEYFSSMSTFFMLLGLQRLKMALIATWFLWNCLKNVRLRRFSIAWSINLLYIDIFSSNDVEFRWTDAYYAISKQMNMRWISLEKSVFYKTTSSHLQDQKWIDFVRIQLCFIIQRHIKAKCKQTRWACLMFWPKLGLIFVNDFCTKTDKNRCD